MGVSSTARLPSIGAQSIPQLLNHLQTSSNAQNVSRWNVTIRSFRAVPVPTNVWPTDETSDNAGPSSSSSSQGPAPLTKPRTMWQVWMSDYPGVVFIIVEDAGKASRAKVWRDWEHRKRSTKVRPPQSQHTSGPTETRSDQTSNMEIDATADQEASEEGISDLHVPSHTRYSVTAVTSSMSSMLTSLNLPPPHGAPVGTAGPGAWVPRGAAVSIEGIFLDINSQNMNGMGGLVGVSSTESLADKTSIDWRVRVGSVVGGGGRSAGAVIEAEFLPMSALLPTSSYLHNFLLSLLPSSIVNVPSHQSSHSFSTPAKPANQQVSGANVVASTLANTASGASFTYVIGPNAKLVGNTPNSTFNIPTLSDQLWEEVVPQSAATWRRMIISRSHSLTEHMANSDKKASDAMSPFEWQSMDSKGVSTTQPQAATEHDGSNGTQNTVTQDGDKDGDRPVGAPPRQADIAAEAAPADLHLSFEGLRSDLASETPETAGWCGIERGRRVAFHYVQMLRAEGII